MGRTFYQRALPAAKALPGGLGKKRLQTSPVRIATRRCRVGILHE